MWLCPLPLALFLRLAVLLFATAAAFHSTPRHHTLIARSPPSQYRVCNHLQTLTTTRSLETSDRLTTTQLSCGFVDALQNLFQGAGVSGSSTVTASHILIKGGPEAASKLESLKSEIGDDPIRFGDLAARYSDCSSASKGGDLGDFQKGKMVKEFDDVVFDPSIPIGVVQGPIRTEFGYHLILVRERT